MTLLEVSALHTHYGAIEALKGVSLTVDAGEVVTLIGSNGAGKSTTLRSISGLTPASTGTITFAGEEITRVPAHEIVIRGIALAPEGRHCFPRKTSIASTTFSPGSRSASTRRRARCPAASSRCSRSGGR